MDCVLSIGFSTPKGWTTVEIAEIKENFKQILIYETQAKPT